MYISRIAEGEIPQRHKDAGSALGKRLAALDKVRMTQQSQRAQTVQKTQCISFAEMLSQAQQAQKTQPAEKLDSSARGLVGERAHEMLADSETQVARVVSGWK